MDTATLSGYLDRIEEQGYCIVENAIDPDLIKEVTNSVAHLEEEFDVQPRGNRAEGFATKRMYNLLACLLYTSQRPRD